jgi:threonine aldolase
MARYFKSDNTAPVAPAILAALTAANEGYTRGYGDDPWTLQLAARFNELFEREVRVFPVATGTAANALALATLVPPYGAVLCHEEAHIVRDECGAPEFMSGGARLQLLPGPGAKLTPAALARGLDDLPTSVHTVQPRAVSISQATELGTVYRPDELLALSTLAHVRGLRVHMDGARFANAMAFLGCSPADATWRSGVDVLSFGATKNGAMAAEAVVFFDQAQAADFEFRRKRAAHLFSKMRYVSAQLLAYVEDGLWLRLAAGANAHARRIGHAAGSLLLHPVEANEVFVRPGAAGIAALRAQGFEFYDWGASDSGEARFVVSWDQKEDDVAALCAALVAVSGTVAGAAPGEPVAP